MKTSKEQQIICPHCNTRLVTFKYVGYYDRFYGWKCGCETLPQQDDSKFIRGAYGFEREWSDSSDEELA